MVRSAYPLALLLPTVFIKCLMPSSWSYLEKLPAHSKPWSVRTQSGLLHLAITSLKNHSAVRKACLLLSGVASTHLDKQSTATAK